MHSLLLIRNKEKKSVFNGILYILLIKLIGLRHVAVLPITLYTCVLHLYFLNVCCH